MKKRRKALFCCRQKIRQKFAYTGKSGILYTRDEERKISSIHKTDSPPKKFLSLFKCRCRMQRHLCFSGEKIRHIVNDNIWRRAGNGRLPGTHTIRKEWCNMPKITCSNIHCQYNKLKKCRKNNVKNNRIQKNKK